MVGSMVRKMRLKSDLGSGQWRKLTAAENVSNAMQIGIYTGLSTRDLLPKARKDEDLSTSPGIMVKYN